MSVLVSVIIPAYRCASTIRQAIDSALAQKVDLEILVINDCSPDDLDSVMEAYRDRKQVRYYKNDSVLGAGRSRNRGVKMAEGKYVAFLDADDWWSDGKLKKQLAILEGEEAPVLCATGRELVTPDGELTGREISVKERISYRQLLLHNSINCSSVVLLREVALEFPMEHDDGHEDYLTWLRILKKYGYARAVNEPLLKYRASAAGKSGNKLTSARMTYRTYRFAGFGRLPAGLLFCAYALNGAAKYARAYLKA